MSFVMACPPNQNKRIERHVYKDSEYLRGCKLESTVLSRGNTVFLGHMCSLRLSRKVDARSHEVVRPSITAPRFRLPTCKSLSRFAETLCCTGRALLHRGGLVMAHRRCAAQSQQHGSSRMCYGPSVVLCRTAAVNAIASGSQHSTMRAISTG